MDNYSFIPKIPEKYNKLIQLIRKLAKEAGMDSFTKPESYGLRDWKSKNNQIELHFDMSSLYEMKVPEGSINVIGGFATRDQDYGKKFKAFIKKHFEVIEISPIKTGLDAYEAQVTPLGPIWAITPKDKEVLV